MSESGIPDVNLLNWLLAFAPIATLLVLMVVFKMGGARAGAGAWIVAFAVSMLRFGAGSYLIANAQGKAALLSIWVLYIIWAALFLFHLVNESGSISIISQGIARVTNNRVMQVVMLAWIFTSFLQGIAGYGVPVAVVAPLMVGLGFTPIAAVVMTSIGHAWAVTFGSLGASFYAIIGVTNFSAEALATEAALLLGFACFLCGAGTLWASKGFSALRAGLPLVIIIGIVMSLAQLAMAELGAYSLAAFTGGATGLLTIVILSRLPRFRHVGRSHEVKPVEGASVDEPEPVETRDLLIAFSAYVILVVIVLAAKTIAPLEDALGALAIKVPFPETSTSFGWTNEAVDSFQTIEPFGEAGALLLYAAIGGILIYWRTGRMSVPRFRRVVGNTVNSALGSSLGIVTMVGMAITMTDSGMTYLLAKGIVEVAGPIYPLLAPFVGVLGAFMTGSNTNSNVLFGALQRDSAVLLGLPPTVLLAAQTVGGGIGAMFAPAKVIVGCSTVGLAGDEGPAISRLVRYGVILAGLVGVVTLIWSLLV